MQTISTYKKDNETRTLTLAPDGTITFMRAESMKLSKRQARTLQAIHEFGVGGMYAEWAVDLPLGSYSDKTPLWWVLNEIDDTVMIVGEALDRAIGMPLLDDVNTQEVLPKGVREMVRQALAPERWAGRKGPTTLEREGLNEFVRLGLRGKWDDALVHWRALQKFFKRAKAHARYIERVSDKDFDKHFPDWK